MTDVSDPNESLAAFLLGETEPGRRDSPHIDENTLALLEMGAMTGEELAELRLHLATCVACRQAAGESLADVTSSSAFAAADLPQPRRWSRPTVILAAAASVLLACALFFYDALPLDGTGRKLAMARRALESGDSQRGLEVLRPLLGNELTRSQTTEARRMARQAYADVMLQRLKAASFPQVESLAEEAKGVGVQSARLASLHSQAVRKMPGPLALDFARRLDQVDPGSVVLQVPVGPKAQSEDAAARKACEILETAPVESDGQREAMLNRAHALLLSDPAESLRHCEHLLAGNPQDAQAMLGKGLAEYQVKKYRESAATFQALLRLRPKDDDVRINFALALEKSGDEQQAVAQWQEIAERHSDPKVRAMITNRLRFLKSGD